jgi:hypothetical protein
MRQGNPHAAGVAMGAPAMMACVPVGDAHQLVRPVGTATAALDAWADWGSARDIPPVAMAATGVYWSPLFATLDARGMPGCLSSAPVIPPVPGRTSDGLACQWMHTLSGDGVVKAALRPEAALVALRPR